MGFLTIIAFIIILVIFGTILNNIFPKIPAALFQILLGIIFSFLPISQNFSFDTNAFITLVIAPLLFTDGYKISRSKFWLYKKPILLMAVVLVLISVFIVGEVIHILLPSIPVSATFALAAILAPTDAVAVKSITKGMKLPKGLMDILEGESLLNDAASLVAFNIALSAVITNTFSISQAVQNFFKVALGGAVIGVILGLILVKLKSIIGNLVASEYSALVIFQILTPVVVYYIAEHGFHVSGIVAVVMTAILYNLEKDVLQKDNLSSETSVLIESNQTTIAYILNGFVFVFLGYLVPEIFAKIDSDKQINVYLLILYVLIITLTMMIIRFLFVYIFHVRFPVHSFSSLQGLTKSLYNRKMDIGNYSRFEYALITAISGIHGTITIATALLIPVTIASTGEIFPLRDSLLFIASSVVLLSIIIATIFLPLVVKNEAVKEEESLANKVRKNAILTAIKELEKNHIAYTPINSNSKETDIQRKKQIAYALVIKKLYEQAIFFSEKSEEKQIIKDFNAIHKKILLAERKKISDFRKTYGYKDIMITVQKIRQLRRTKFITYSITKHVFLQIKLALKEYLFAKHLRKHSVRPIIANRRKNKTDISAEEIFTRIAENTFRNYSDIVADFNLAAQEVFKNTDKNYHPLAVEFLSKFIDNSKNILFISFIKDPHSYQHEYEKLLMDAIQLQKYQILTMHKLNYISHSETDIILKELSYSEALLVIHDE